MRFCQVGCGRHAFAIHGPAQATFAPTHPGFERVACCDPDRARAEAYARAFGFEAAYDDIGAMLDAVQPDAAALVVPEGSTCELACALFARGVALLIEKPPGRTVAEVDRLIRASERDGAAAVPHSVAFNRRFAPLVRELERRIGAIGGPPAIQHVHYDMVRIDRRDADFSTTAIHGIDLVRALTHADYAAAAFRYHPHPGLGPGVADLFMCAELTTGASATLSFCPVAGVVVERVTVHAHGHTFYLQIPMWNAFDSPGSLRHLHEGRLVAGLAGDAAAADIELGGFYDEYVAFVEALERGAPPRPDLRAVRQSVQVAEAMRARARTLDPDAASPRGVAAGREAAVRADRTED